MKSSKKKYSDPINEMDESIYISSTMRSNFNKDSEADFDKEMSLAVGSHLANCAVPIIGSSRAHSMISGYINFQQTITKKAPHAKTGNMVNAAKVISVEEIAGLDISVKKNKDSFVLGKKLELSFYSSNSDDIESISTSWFDYYGYGDSVFEICLSRSLAACLIVIRDMKLDSFRIRKSYPREATNKDGKSIRVRELVDVFPVGRMESTAAIIGQNVEAIEIGIEEGSKEALTFLKDEGLYDEYRENAFGLGG